jgi:hypothetical protein
LCCRIEEWFCAKGGQLVTCYQICELYGDALSRIARGAVVDNGLRATGLLLYEGSIFMPHDFLLAAESTDVALHHCGACHSMGYQPCAKSERSQILVMVQQRKNEFILQKFCWGNWGKKEKITGHWIEHQRGCVECVFFVFGAAYKYKTHVYCLRRAYSCMLTLILLTCRIWWAPNNASKWQMGINSEF